MKHQVASVQVSVHWCTSRSGNSVGIGSPGRHVPQGGGAPTGAEKANDSPRDPRVTPRRVVDSSDVLARVNAGLDLVRLIASQLRSELSRHVQPEELVSYGNEGLLAAARSFDDTRGVPFRAWANLRIRGAMLDGLRRSGALPRSAYRKLRAAEAEDAARAALFDATGEGLPLSAKEADARLTARLSCVTAAILAGLVAGGSAEDVSCVPTDDPSPEEALHAAEVRSLLRAALDHLPMPERTVIERHYFAEKTVEEAAAELGLSKSWGSRLHSRAVAALGRAIARKSRPAALCDY